MARRRRTFDRPLEGQAVESVRIRLRSPIVLAPGSDRRVWHPGGAKAPPSSFRRADRRIVLKKSSRFAPARNDTYSDWRVQFAVPSRVAICVRRKQRKEVLHALKLTGKGSGARRHRRNYWSGVDC